jgi:hypothetical protein
MRFLESCRDDKRPIALSALSLNHAGKQPSEPVVVTAVLTALRIQEM